MNDPQSSFAAEQAVLSCAMQNPRWFMRHLHSLPPAAFADQRNQILATELIDMVVCGQQPDPILLSNRIRSIGKMETIGGPSYLSEVYTSVMSPNMGDSYLTLIVQAYAIRRQIEAHTKAIEVLQQARIESEATTAAAMDEVAAILDEARHTPGKLLSRRHVKDVAVEVMDQIEDRQANPGKLAGFPTGFAQIDKQTGGLQPGHVWVFAGMPGDGKSAIIQNMAEAASAAGARIGWYPLEMPDTEQTFRVISSLAGVDNGALYSGLLSRGQQEAIGAALKRMKGLGIEMVQTDGASASTIIADIERANYDIAVVDYLQLLEDDGPRKGASREEIIAGISRRLKKLAKRSKTCILTASQLNDNGKLRESRAIGQDADKVFIIQKCPSDRKEGRIAENIRDDQEFDDTRRILWADKNRGGKRHFEVPMKFLGQIFQFREIDQDTP